MFQEFREIFFFLRKLVTQTKKILYLLISILKLIYNTLKPIFHTMAIEYSSLKPIKIKPPDFNVIYFAETFNIRTCIWAYIVVSLWQV